MKGKMFECSCGEVIYADKTPDECPACGDLNGFVELPEELVKEREQDMEAMEEIYDEEYE